MQWVAVRALHSRVHCMLTRQACRRDVQAQQCPWVTYTGERPHRIMPKHMRRLMKRSPHSTRDQVPRRACDARPMQMGAQISRLQHTNAGPEHPRNAHTHAQRPHALLHSGTRSTFETVAPSCVSIGDQQNRCIA